MLKDAVSEPSSVGADVVSLKIVKLEQMVAGLSQKSAIFEQVFDETHYIIIIDNKNKLMFDVEILAKWDEHFLAFINYNFIVQFQ